MNGRVGVTQYGRNARVENVPGTTIISQAVYPPYGTNICIGSCIDTEGQKMLWFIFNTFGDHGIYCFDFVDNQVYAVIYDSQVQEGLNFNKNYRIDKNCRVINGVLYWSDNYNEPKKIISRSLSSSKNLSQSPPASRAIAANSPWNAGIVGVRGAFGAFTTVGLVVVFII